MRFLAVEVLTFGFARFYLPACSLVAGDVIRYATVILDLSGLQVLRGGGVAGMRGLAANGSENRCSTWII